jgi:predicted anti-sigma-YlaC factor YlaD
MNCQFCQQRSDAYFGGKLSEDRRSKVEAHLQSCEDCTESYNLLSLAEKVIEHEKEINPDHFLTARIMARIEAPEEYVQKFSSQFKRILRPAMIATALAAAVFAGVSIGNLYMPSARVLSKPVEFALIDDITIEAVDILTNE